MMTDTGWIELTPQQEVKSLDPLAQQTAAIAQYRERQSKAAAKRQAAEERQAESRQAAERLRLTQRDRIKRQKVAALESAERLAKIDGLIASCESRKESFASSHVEACKPLQEQLQDLEASGQDDSAEYDEVRSAVDSLNERLKAAITREDRRISELRAERYRLAEASNVSLLDAQLIQFGSPPLLEKMHAANNVATSLEGLAARAREQGARLRAEMASRFASVARRESEEATAAVINE